MEKALISLMTLGDPNADFCKVSVAVPTKA